MFMNNDKLRVCEIMESSGNITQREMATELSFSLGYINKCVQELKADGYISGKGLTENGRKMLAGYKVDNAIILAANLDFNFVPLTYSRHQCMIEINGRPIIEIQIQYLLDKGISDITICVGYMKEQFEYLKDKYGVKLFHTSDYANKVNLTSLAQVSHLLGNTYIIAGFKYFETNPFNKYDCEDWYGVLPTDKMQHSWFADLGRKNQISRVKIGYDTGLIMTGPAHFTRNFSRVFKPLLMEYAQNPSFNTGYWENVLQNSLNDLPALYARKMEHMHHLMSFEMLRDIDPSYKRGTRDGIMAKISEVFNIPEDSITIDGPIKNGITNTSFLFIVNGKRYVFRKPGEETEKFIDRRAEYNCYNALAGTKLADEPLYFDYETGVKITPYYENSRHLDIRDPEDKPRFITYLHTLHKSGLQVEHKTDLIEYVYFYEELFAKERLNFGFRDYDEVRNGIVKLWEEAGSDKVQRTLTHHDTRNENFLLLPSGELRLIDWEYGGMSDPYSDLALVGTFENLSVQECDDLLHMYLQRHSKPEERLRLYTQLAFSGLWSAQWARYKEEHGDELGSYTLDVYGSAKMFMREAYKLLA